MKKFWLFLPLLILVGFAGVTAFLLTKDQDLHMIETGRVNTSAPVIPDNLALPLTDSDIPAFDDQDLRAHAPVIVNIFASWCVPCLAEHPFFTRLEREFDIPIFGIAFMDQAEDTRNWLEEQGNPYQAVIMDSQGYLAIEWGTVGVPETFLIDHEGIIRYHHAGPITAHEFEDIHTLYQGLYLDRPR